MQALGDEPSQPMAQVSERGDEIVHQEVSGNVCNHFDEEWQLLENYAQNISTIFRQRLEGAREDAACLMRPRTSWDFIDYGNTDPMWPLFDQDIDKEGQLVEDLLNCFLGFHGKFIYAERLTGPHDERVFKISDKVTGACRSMAMRLIPLASYYSRIVRYVQSGMDITAGRVNQALAGFLQEKILKFSEMIVTLDERHSSNPLVLNHLYFCLQNTMESMKMLNDLVCSVEGVRGGETLSALHVFTNRCIVDSPTKKLAFDATVAASKPYFQSISVWIYRGILFDPYDEFMISQKLNGLDGSNWDSMFMIRELAVPVFLKECQTYIYKAGKYLDAVRKSVQDCEQLTNCIVEDTLSYGTNDENYVEIVKRAYNFANMCLRDILLNRYDLFERIKTAKSFLSLEGGDLFHNIIDNCAEELDRPAHEVCISYLPLLISSSVETSSLGGLKHANQMALYLERETLRWQVYNLHSNIGKINECLDVQSGMEALSFKVATVWPVSLVIHQMSIKCYQMLFRHLFHLKRVHFKLVRIDYRKFTMMRQNYLKHMMIVFLQCCISYMTLGTVEVYWLEFKTAFNIAKTIEEIRQAYDSMLYKCLQGCMLASPILFHKLKKALELCIRFSEDMLLKHETPFIAAVSSLIHVASLERRSAGLKNFTNEIAPIFQYEPRMALSSIIIDSVKFV